MGLVFLLIVATAVIRRLGKSRTSRRPTFPAEWQPPEADSLPYSKKKYFFSTAERSFYEIVQRLMPEHTIFAKVRLADLVYVNKGTASWQSYFNRIRSKHLDFVLCGPDLAPVLAIELDDASHDGEERRERDAFVDEVLATVALPIVHVRAKRGYVLDDLRLLLGPYVRSKLPLDFAHLGLPCVPPAGWRPNI